MTAAGLGAEEAAPQLPPIKTVPAANGAAVDDGPSSPVTPVGRAFAHKNLDVYVACIIGLREALTLEELKEWLSDTLVHHKRFRSIIMPGGFWAGPRWQRVPVSIGDHVQEWDLPPSAALPPGRDPAEDFAAGLATVPPMDRRLPLWRCHLLHHGENAGRRTSLIFHIHHALGDGVSLMSLLMATARQAADPSQLPTLPTHSAAKEPTRGFLAALCLVLVVIWNTLVRVPAYIGMVLGIVKDSPSAVKGSGRTHLSTKRLASSEEVALSDAAIVRKTVPGSTINDVLLAAFAGGLRKYLDRAEDKTRGSGHGDKKVSDRSSGGREGSRGGEGETQGARYHLQRESEGQGWKGQRGDPGSLESLQRGDLGSQESLQSGDLGSQDPTPGGSRFRAGGDGLCQTESDDHECAAQSPNQGGQRDEGGADPAGTGSGDGTERKKRTRLKLRVRGVALVNRRDTPGLQDLSMMLHGKSKVPWGNLIGTVMIPIPVLDSDTAPLKRVRQVRASTARAKQSGEAAFSYANGLIITKTVGSGAAVYMLNLSFRHSTLSVSNLVGPVEEISLAGHHVTCITPLGFGFGYAIALYIISYRHHAKYVIVTADEVVRDPEVLAKDCVAAFYELKAAALKETGA